MKITIILLFLSVGAYCQNVICPQGQPCYTIPLNSQEIAQATANLIAAQNQHIADSISLVQKQSTIIALKSQSYKILQGLTVGSTPTAQQQTAAFWINLYNTGAINPVINKIDSTFNYIH